MGKNFSMIDVPEWLHLTLLLIALFAIVVALLWLMTDPVTLFRFVGLPLLLQ